MAKRLFTTIILFCLTIFTLTGCSSGFEGKWDCVEAEVNTYGGVLSGGYKAIEQTGMVSTMCEVEIDGNNITYSELTDSFKITNVNRNGNTITFTASNNLGVTDKVTLKLTDNDKTIIATRYKNTYTLKRADLFHKILNNIPVWVYFVLGGALLLTIIGKIVSAKSKPNNNT